MSKRGRVGVSASFLNEVPFDLIEKRRSGRGRRGVGSSKGGIDSNSESLMESPRGDDMTAKALLESLLPQTLIENSNEEKNSTPNTPMKKLANSPDKKAEIKIIQKGIILIFQKNFWANFDFFFFSF